MISYMSSMLVRCIFALLLSLLCTGVMGQTTYYYKQTKTVDSNKQVGVGDNTGQFVSFTHSGCYDSDKDGFNVNNGFLKLLKTTSDLRIYYGPSYWGMAYYYVKADYSKINVKIVESGKTLVYDRATPAAKVFTSSHIKKSAPGNGVVIINNQEVFIPENGNSQITGEMQNVTCTFCSGTGTAPYPTYYGGITDRYIYCNTCKKADRDHYHSSCPSCQGKGYTTKYLPKKR